MIFWTITAFIVSLIFGYVAWRLDKIVHHHDWAPWGKPQECTYKGKITIVQTRACRWLSCGKAQVRAL